MGSLRSLPKKEIIQEPSQKATPRLVITTTGFAIDDIDLERLLLYMDPPTMPNVLLSITNDSGTALTTRVEITALSQG